MRAGDYNLSKFFTCFLCLAILFSVSPLRSSFAQENVEEDINSPIPNGTIIEYWPGDVDALLKDEYFTFGQDLGQPYSLILRPDFGEVEFQGPKFSFLPKDVEKIVKIPTSSGGRIGASITLEVDPNYSGGIRLTEMDFPSFYWGNSEPLIFEENLEDEHGDKDFSDRELAGGEKAEDRAIELDASARDALSSQTTSDFLENRDIPKRALWVRDKNLWQKHPSLLLTRIMSLGIGKVFIEIEVIKGEIFPTQSVELEKFIKFAHQKDIYVWATFKAGNLGFRPWQDVWAIQAETVYNYNKSVRDEGKLDGTQFDLKPHLIEGFDIENNDWQELFLTRLSKLKSAARDVPLYLSLPSWFPGLGRDEYLAERMPDFIDGLTVWSFQSVRLDINRVVNPFLSWGERHNKPILIAFETGRPTPERRWNYLKNSQGNLFTMSLNSELYLVFLNKSMDLQNVDVFTLAQFKDIPNLRATYFGRLSEVLDIIPTLEVDMSYFLTFDGIALNGLLEF